MFKIGDFSKLAQVSVKTLRYYDRLGLLKPAWIDRYSGYRYYTAGQLPRLNRILALKDLGFSLDQVKRLLQDDLPVAELRGMMRMKRLELEGRLQEEQARLERVENRLRQIEHEGGKPAYDVVLKSVPTQQVLGVRELVAGNEGLVCLFARLHAFLASQNLALDASHPRLVIYYDREYRERGMDVEAAVPLSRPLASISGFRAHQLEAVGDMACTVHQGSIREMDEARNSLMAWIETNGYRVAGPNRDVYLQAHQIEQMGAEGVAEVQFPVQRKSNPILISENQEESKMEPKIVSRAAFTAVGMIYCGKNENQEIAGLWREFTPRMSEIKHVVDGAFGLCAPADESGAFKYMASFAVSDTSQIPEGMQVWEVPAQKYAVFPTTLDKVGETYKYAFETWLPGLGYEYTQGPDFEYYDENFDPEVEGSKFEIYVPIK
jgi:predicted transcriptional regulator YdeE/DNA-binding transcriptional MerR regulator